MAKKKRRMGASYVHRCPPGFHIKQKGHNRGRICVVNR